MGSANNKLFNKTAFINVNDFDTFEGCVNYVVNLSEDEIVRIRNEPIYNDTNNDLINLINDDYNNTNDNKILTDYINKLEHFLTSQP